MGSACSMQRHNSARRDSHHSRSVSSLQARVHVSSKVNISIYDLHLVTYERLQFFFSSGIVIKAPLHRQGASPQLDIVLHDIQSLQR